jgi:hypothetical protein
MVAELLVESKMRRLVEIIWRDIAPVVALVLALLLTFWTRDTASAQYLNTQPNAAYQSQLWSADADWEAWSLTRRGP